MIYFFDNDLQLQKVTTGQNILLAQHEHELNNLIRADVAVDLSYAKSFIDDVDHFGYYYKDVFYLHKITTVESDHKNELLILGGRHVFFEDMLFGDLIRDVRPQNQEAGFMLRQTIEANTRWNIVMTDVTGRLSTNFYWVPPYEALEWITENFRLEYLPVILFDGQNINGYQLHVKKRIGEQKHIRIPWGERVEQLTHEIDYSEIITKLSVRGKGEEVGEGYGRRIHIGEINFSRNGVVSPSGNRYLEDPDITATYGNDGQTPREGDVTFEDIEVASELVEAGYHHYLDVSRPQVLISADVAQIGDVAIGDGVLIIRREHEMYFEARVHKLSVDLLNQEDAQIELGDYDHFKETKVERRTRQNNERVERELSSRIQQLKLDFDYRFDGEVKQMLEDYEQALIDVHAKIEADRERMETLINTTRNDWTETFESELAEIYRKADEDYNRIEAEITGMIDSTRNDMETQLNDSVQSTRTYAEQQAQEKAAAVRTDLEAVTSGHQSMLEDLESNVMNIDDFLGAARDIPLDQRFLDMTRDFDRQIRNSTRSASNMLRGTRFDEPDMYNRNFVGVSLHTTEHVNFIRLNTIQSNIPLVIMNGELHLHAGVEYHLHIEYRTDTVTELDGFVFYHNDGTTERLENRGLAITGLTTSGAWEHASLTLSPNAEMSGRLAIGTRRTFGTSPDGIIDVRLPYLTTTAHDQWLPHPLDANQNIEEISRRITQLEDGYSDFIVRSVWDAEMHSMTQTIRDYRTTVDGVEDTIIKLQDSEVITRGREVIDTVDGFSRKVWLGDIDRPNLIPFADVLRISNRDEWIGRGSRFNGSNSGLTIVQADSLGNYIGMESPKIYDYVESGETYTLSWEGHHLSGYQLSGSFDYVYLVGMSGNNIRLYNIQRTAVIGYTNRYRYTATFEMPSTITENTRILFGVSRDGESGGLAYVRFGKPKLELGNIASPFETSFSMLEQRADAINLQVDDQDSRLSRLLVDLDGISGTVANIEGDYIKQSSLEITPEYAQIGSMRIDGDTVGSLLRVSPSGIDAVAEAMRLSGDLYVDGDITTLAVDAIEGNFARLWADEFSAITIDVGDIQGVTAEFNRMYTLNANIERLVSQTVFANGVNALVGNFVDVNAGNIVTSGLSANVIKSSHLDVDTTMVRKLFATSARIDQLITRNHYVDNVKTLSIDAVHADLRSVNSEIMTSNIIKSNWLDVDTALFNRFTASSAFISSLTSKSAFIRDIQAIEITANQLNLTTLTNRINQIEGGLRITRIDGVDWVRNGQARGHVPVQIFDSYSSDEVGFTGLNFYTGTSHWQTFKYFYTPHEGTRLRITWAVGLHEGPSTIEYMEVRVRNFSSYSPINSGVGTSSRRVTIRQGETTYVTQDVSMPPPNYNEMAAYLEFRRAPDGQSINNVVRARILHIGQYE